MNEILEINKLINGEYSPEQLHSYIYTSWKNIDFGFNISEANIKMINFIALEINEYRRNITDFEQEGLSAFLNWLEETFNELVHVHVPWKQGEVYTIEKMCENGWAPTGSNVGKDTHRMRKGAVYCNVEIDPETEEILSFETEIIFINAEQHVVTRGWLNY